MAQVHHERVRRFRRAQASMIAQAGPAVGFRIANVGTFVN
jgi:hypothetical protein